MIRKNYHIVASGFKSIKNNSHNPEVFETPKDHKEALDDFVVEAIKSAEAKGGQFFDGDMVGVTGFSIDEKDVIIDTQAMKYSQHAGLFRTMHDAPIQAMYVCGLVLTSDNKLVFGNSQFTEADFMGKLGIPAGVIVANQDGVVLPLRDQLYGRLEKEMGLTEAHYDRQKVTPGWVTGMSRRESSFHYTTSFVVPLGIDSHELNEHFKTWKTAQDDALQAQGKKPELKELRYLPNNPEIIMNYLAIEDKKGNATSILGKTADVVEAWALEYGSHAGAIVRHNFEKGPKIYIPQPKL